MRFHQGMLYRVKNDRKVIEIATILSSEQEGNLEQERVGKFKINNIIAPSCIPHSKVKRAENSKFFMSIFILFSSLFMLIFTVGHFIRFFRPILVIQIIQSTHAKVKPIL